MNSNEPDRLFLTDPHGAQSLVHLKTEGDEKQPIGNHLFTLCETAPNELPLSTELRQITMTGEELDSLAAQWAEYRRRNP